jgi:hypothetical protein
MPRKKILTDEECHKRLNIAVDNMLDHKLGDFQKQVCGPRILLTDKINNDIAQLKIGQDTILHRLDNVSANGNKGLESSLKDVYGKIAETHTEVLLLKNQITEVLYVTEGPRAWKTLSNSAKKVLSVSPIFKIFKNKMGRIFAIVIALLVLNTILHTLGISWTLQDIIKFVKPMN